MTAGKNAEFREKALEAERNEPKTQVRTYAFLVLSWACVAFGQPVWSGPLGILASLGGFALFWRAAPPNFWLATAWFTAVQAVQLSWLTSTEYMGPLIVVVYALLCCAIGLQFGALTHLLRQPLTLRRMLMIGGVWVWMEWMRLGLLTGFPWNPVGLSLAGEASIQFAALFGVYGLSFWVILTNLAALRSRRLWVALAIVPYAFSWMHAFVWEKRPETPMSVALVQTALRIEQKDLTAGRDAEFISPLVQWKRILEELAETRASSWDVIALPESALPWGAAKCYYPLDLVEEVWRGVWGAASVADFPPLELPFAKRNSKSEWLVSNAFWAKSLANHFQAHVVVGLDASEREFKYNAAFHFSPTSVQAARYDKQRLVPVGEYVPLASFPLVARWCAEQFGIEASFDTGTASTIFQATRPMGVSICSEETYGDLLRSTRQKGAELFVNLSNDAWFPGTRLPEIHYQHARLRSAENGVMALRSCHTGMTGIVDRFGRSVQTLPRATRGVLTAKIAVQSHPTLYTLLGDAPVLMASALFILAGIWASRVTFWKLRR